jgi:hypothetical protein
MRLFRGLWEALWPVQIRHSHRAEPALAASRCSNPRLTTASAQLTLTTRQLGLGISLPFVILLNSLNERWTVA